MRTAAIVLVVGLVDCSGSKGGEDTAGGVDPTLTNVQARVFSPSCGLSNVCHASPGSSGLVLEDGVAWAAIVNVESHDNPGHTLVVPSDSASSYLVAKLQGDPGIVGTSMPQGGSLDAEDLQLVIDWIDAGALDN